MTTIHDIDDDSIKYGLGDSNIEIAHDNRAGNPVIFVTVFDIPAQVEITEGRHGALRAKLIKMGSVRRFLESTGDVSVLLADVREALRPRSCAAGAPREQAFAANT